MNMAAIFSLSFLLIACVAAVLVQSKSVHVRQAEGETTAETTSEASSSQETTSATSEAAGSSTTSASSAGSTTTGKGGATTTVKSTGTTKPGTTAKGGATTPTTTATTKKAPKLSAYMYNKLSDESAGNIDRIIRSSGNTARQGQAPVQSRVDMAFAPMRFLGGLFG